MKIILIPLTPAAEINWTLFLRTKVSATLASLMLPPHTALFENPTCSNRSLTSSKLSWANFISSPLLFGPSLISLPYIIKILKKSAWRLCLIPVRINASNPPTGIASRRNWRPSLTKNSFSPTSASWLTVACAFWGWNGAGKGSWKSVAATTTATDSRNLSFRAGIVSLAFTMQTHAPDNMITIQIISNSRNYSVVNRARAPRRTVKKKKEPSTVAFSSAVASLRWRHWCSAGYDETKTSIKRCRL